MGGAKNIVHQTRRSMVLHGVQVAVDRDLDALLLVVAVVVQLVKEVRFVVIVVVDDMFGVN